MGSAAVLVDARHEHYAHRVSDECRMSGQNAYAQSTQRNSWHNLDLSAC